MNFTMAQSTHNKAQQFAADGRPFHCGCASITRAPLCAGVKLQGKSMQRLFAAIILIFGCHAIQASEFEPNVEMNQRVIKALIEAGSVPTKPHPLEHHFLCYTSDCLQELMEMHIPAHRDRPFRLNVTARSG